MSSLRFPAHAKKSEPKIYCDSIFNQSHNKSLLYIQLLLHLETMHRLFGKTAAKKAPAPTLDDTSAGLSARLKDCKSTNH